MEVLCQEVVHSRMQWQDNKIFWQTDKLQSSCKPANIS